MQLAGRGAALVERVADLADHERLGRIARDRASRRPASSRRIAPRAGALDADDQPLHVVAVDDAAADPAMAVLVVVDQALAQEVLAVDREDVVDAQVADGALEQLVAVPPAALSGAPPPGSALRRSFAAIPTAAAPPTTVSTTSRIQITARTIHAALRQRNLAAPLDTQASAT